MSWCGVYKVGPGLSERLRACPSFEAHLGNVHAHRVNISLKWPRWIISVAATTAWPDGLRTSENCAIWPASSASTADAINYCAPDFSKSVNTSVNSSRRGKSTILDISMVVYLLRLGCCLTTTSQRDTPRTFKSSKHQIHP